MTLVLVVDDSAVDRRLVGELLERRFQCHVEYAANGVEAMARMKGLRPDMIVTDLTMPVMDGLELVRAVRIHHPGVPVILMTAFGSETLAIEALEQGAASYVPKSQLADRLLDTMEEVLTMARADRSHEQLVQSLEQCSFRFVLENDPALIDPLVEMIQKMVGGMGLVDFTGRLQVGVALKEALLNALFHGNLEITQEDMQAVESDLIQDDDLSLVEQRRMQTPYRDRKIFVGAELTKERARFTIRDEGSGFDVSAVPDITQPGALEPEGRRGLSLMRTFMNEVTFNDVGNELTMLKYADAAVGPSPPREFHQ